ncbi:TetR/AcrR family transcriptional regulator [Actinoplanes rectilineatus]|uniref:TetR/AcrR family transcriptional regulator n=1 Tax=Actinoplanes rectilineatus TaxID=113571 RepID=UPI0005F2E3EE|nr:TetR/AcrR family transcriptional regulator [Actinoplanes rectilineatus]
MPRLWNDTVDEHRRSVRAAILDNTAALVNEHGMGVTMSQIAGQVGIGRATLYKYFPDVEAIMVAWHERQVGEHLRQLTDTAALSAEPGERLRTVLATYAELSSGGRDGHQPSPPAGHGMELAAPLHRAEHMHHARQRLHELVTGVIAAAVSAGVARTDVPAGELATFCLHALTAAAALPNPAARRRLVTVTLDGVLSPRIDEVKGT